VSECADEDGGGEDKGEEVRCGECVSVVVEVLDDGAVEHDAKDDMDEDVDEEEDSSEDEETEDVEAADREDAATVGDS
jgi:hypothetical protein